MRESGPRGIYGYMYTKIDMASAPTGACRQFRQWQASQVSQLSFLPSTTNSALNEAIGVRLGRVNLGIFAGVLEALVPAEIYQGSD